MTTDPLREAQAVVDTWRGHRSRMPVAIRDLDVALAATPTASPTEAEMALRRLVDACIEGAPIGSKMAVVAFDVKRLVDHVDASPAALAAFYAASPTATGERDQP